MKGIFSFIYLALISLFSPKLEDDEPKSLYKKTEPKKIKLNINKSALLLIIMIMTIFILVSVLIYSSGALESTQYYYRLEWLV